MAGADRLLYTASLSVAPSRLAVVNLDLDLHCGKAHRFSDLVRGKDVLDGTNYLALSPCHKILELNSNTGCYPLETFFVRC